MLRNFVQKHGQKYSSAKFLQEHGNIPRGRNSCIREFRMMPSPLLIFIDSDVLPSKHFIDRLIQVSTMSRRAEIAAIEYGIQPFMPTQPCVSSVDGVGMGSYLRCGMDQIPEDEQARVPPWKVGLPTCEQDHLHQRQHLRSYSRAMIQNVLSSQSLNSDVCVVCIMSQLEWFMYREETGNGPDSKRSSQQPSTTAQYQQTAGTYHI